MVSGGSSSKRMKNMVSSKHSSHLPPGAIYVKTGSSKKMKHRAPSSSSSEAGRASESDSSDEADSSDARLDSDGSVSSEKLRGYHAIVVRNLPKRHKDQTIKEGLFFEFKKIGKAACIKIEGSGRHRIAFCYFRSADECKRIVKEKDQKTFYGKAMEIDPIAQVRQERETQRGGGDRMGVVNYGGQMGGRYDGPPQMMPMDHNQPPVPSGASELDPKSSRTLFIGNVPREIEETDLYKIFRKYGKILDIDVKRMQFGEVTYAFVQYAHIITCVEAINTEDGRKVGPYRCKTNFAKTTPSACLWASGLPEDVNKMNLKRHFSRPHPVSHFIFDQKLGEALLYYQDVNAASEVLATVKTKKIDSTRPYVDFSSKEHQDYIMKCMKNKGDGGTRYSCSPSPSRGRGYSNSPLRRDNRRRSPSDSPPRGGGGSGGGRGGSPPGGGPGRFSPSRRHGSNSSNRSSRSPSNGGGNVGGRENSKQYSKSATGSNRKSFQCSRSRSHSTSSTGAAMIKKSAARESQGGSYGRSKKNRSPSITSSSKRKGVEKKERNLKREIVSSNEDHDVKPLSKKQHTFKQSEDYDEKKDRECNENKGSFLGLSGQNLQDNVEKKIATDSDKKSSDAEEGEFYVSPSKNEASSVGTASVAEAKTETIPVEPYEECDLMMSDQSDIEANIVKQTNEERCGDEQMKENEICDSKNDERHPSEVDRGGGGDFRGINNELDPLHFNSKLISNFTKNADTVLKSCYETEKMLKKTSVLTSSPSKFATGHFLEFDGDDVGENRPHNAATQVVTALLHQNFSPNVGFAAYDYYNGKDSISLPSYVSDEKLNFSKMNKTAYDKDCHNKSLDSFLSKARAHAWLDGNNEEDYTNTSYYGIERSKIALNAINKNNSIANLSNSYNKMKSREDEQHETDNDDGTMEKEEEIGGLGLGVVEFETTPSIGLNNLEKMTESELQLEDISSPEPFSDSEQTRDQKDKDRDIANQLHKQSGPPLPQPISKPVTKQHHFSAPPLKPKSNEPPSAADHSSLTAAKEALQKTENPPTYNSLNINSTENVQMPPFSRCGNSSVKTVLSNSVDGKSSLKPPDVVTTPFPPRHSNAKGVTHEKSSNANAVPHLSNITPKKSSTTNGSKIIPLDMLPGSATINDPRSPVASELKNLPHLMISFKCIQYQKVFSKSTRPSDSYSYNGGITESQSILEDWKRRGIVKPKSSRPDTENENNSVESAANEQRVNELLNKFNVSSIFDQDSQRLAVLDEESQMIGSSVNDVNIVGSNSNLSSPSISLSSPSSILLSQRSYDYPPSSSLSTPPPPLWSSNSLTLNSLSGPGPAHLKIDIPSPSIYFNPPSSRKEAPLQGILKSPGSFSSTSLSSKLDDPRLKSSNKAALTNAPANSVASTTGLPHSTNSPKSDVIRVSDKYQRKPSTTATVAALVAKHHQHKLTIKTETTDHHEGGSGGGGPISVTSPVSSVSGCSSGPNTLTSFVFDSNLNKSPVSSSDLSKKNNDMELHAKESENFNIGSNRELNATPGSTVISTLGSSCVSQSKHIGIDKLEQTTKVSVKIEPKDNLESKQQLMRGEEDIDEDDKVSLKENGSKAAKNEVRNKDEEKETTEQKFPLHSCKSIPSKFNLNKDYSILEPKISIMQNLSEAQIASSKNYEPDVLPSLKKIAKEVESPPSAVVEEKAATKLTIKNEKMGVSEESTITEAANACKINQVINRDELKRVEKKLNEPVIESSKKQKLSSHTADINSAPLPTASSADSNKKDSKERKDKYFMKNTSSSSGDCSLKVTVATVEGAAKSEANVSSIAALSSSSPSKHNSTDNTTATTTTNKCSEFDIFTSTSSKSKPPSSNKTSKAEKNASKRHSLAHLDHANNITNVNKSKGGTFAQEVNGTLKGSITHTEDKGEESSDNEAEKKTLEMLMGNGSINNSNVNQSRNTCKSEDVASKQQLHVGNYNSSSSSTSSNDKTSSDDCSHKCEIIAVQKVVHKHHKNKHNKKETKVNSTTTTSNNNENDVNDHSKTALTTNVIPDKDNEKDCEKLDSAISMGAATVSTLDSNVFADFDCSPLPAITENFTTTKKLSLDIKSSKKKDKNGVESENVTWEKRRNDDDLTSESSNLVSHTKMEPLKVDVEDTSVLKMETTFSSDLRAVHKTEDLSPVIFHKSNSAPVSSESPIRCHSPLITAPSSVCSSNSLKKKRPYVEIVVDECEDQENIDYVQNQLSRPDGIEICIKKVKTEQLPSSLSLPAAEITEGTSNLQRKISKGSPRKSDSVSSSSPNRRSSKLAKSPVHSSCIDDAVRDITSPIETPMQRTTCSMSLFDESSQDDSSVVDITRVHSRLFDCRSTDSDCAEVNTEDNHSTVCKSSLTPNDEATTEHEDRNSEASLSAVSTTVGVGTVIAADESVHNESIHSLDGTLGNSFSTDEAAGDTEEMRLSECSEVDTSITYLTNSTSSQEEVVEENIELTDIDEDKQENEEAAAVEIQLTHVGFPSDEKVVVPTDNALHQEKQQQQQVRPICDMSQNTCDSIQINGENFSRIKCHDPQVSVSAHSGKIDSAFQIAESILGVIESNLSGQTGGNALSSSEAISSVPDGLSAISMQLFNSTSRGLEDLESNDKRIYEYLAGLSTSSAIPTTSSLMLPVPCSDATNISPAIKIEFENSLQLDNKAEQVDQFDYVSSVAAADDHNIKDEHEHPEQTESQQRDVVIDYQKEDVGSICVNDTSIATQQYSQTSSTLDASTSHFSPDEADDEETKSTTRSAPKVPRKRGRSKRTRFTRPTKKQSSANAANASSAAANVNVSNKIKEETTSPSKSSLSTLEDSTTQLFLQSKSMESVVKTERICTKLEIGDNFMASCSGTDAVSSKPSTPTTPVITSTMHPKERLKKQFRAFMEAEQNSNSCGGIAAFDAAANNMITSTAAAANANSISDKEDLVKEPLNDVTQQPTGPSSSVKQEQQHNTIFDCAISNSSSLTSSPLPHMLQTAAVSMLEKLHHVSSPQPTPHTHKRGGGEINSKSPPLYSNSYVLHQPTQSIIYSSHGSNSSSSAAAVASKTYIKCVSSAGSPCSSTDHVSLFSASLSSSQRGANVVTPSTISQELSLEREKRRNELKQLTSLSDVEIDNVEACIESVLQDNSILVKRFRCTADIEANFIDEEVRENRELLESSIEELTNFRHFGKSRKRNAAALSGVSSPTISASTKLPAVAHSSFTRPSQTLSSHAFNFEDIEHKAMMNVRSFHSNSVAATVSSAMAASSSNMPVISEAQAASNSIQSSIDSVILRHTSNESIGGGVLHRKISGVDTKDSNSKATTSLSHPLPLSSVVGVFDQQVPSQATEHHYAQTSRASSSSNATSPSTSSYCSPLIGMQLPFNDPNNAGILQSVHSNAALAAAVSSSNLLRQTTDSTPNSGTAFRIDHNTNPILNGTNSSTGGSSTSSGSGGGGSSGGGDMHININLMAHYPSYHELLPALYAANPSQSASTKLVTLRIPSTAPTPTHLDPTGLESQMFLSRTSALYAMFNKLQNVWEGIVELKNSQSRMNLRFLGGNLGLAAHALDTPSLNINQRMTLEDQELEGLSRNLQNENDYCIMLGLPYAPDATQIYTSHKVLEQEIAKYLRQKEAAGIINIPHTYMGAQTVSVLHIFPPCEFARDYLMKLDVSHHLATSSTSYLLFILTSANFGSSSSLPSSSNNTNTTSSSNAKTKCSTS